MKSARAKGLDFCREVKGILKGIGHRVEGPGYGVAFFNKRQNPIHRDYWGVFDLMSFDGLSFIGHQVSTSENKSVKIKNLQSAGLPGWVWCRFRDDDSGQVGYQVYVVTLHDVTECEMIYGIRRKSLPK